MTDHTRDSRLKTLTPQDVKETTIVDVDELDTTDIAGPIPALTSAAAPNRGTFWASKRAAKRRPSAIRRKMRTSAGADLEKAAAKAREDERNERKQR